MSVRELNKHPGFDHRFKRRPKGSTVGGYVRPRVQIGFDDEMRAAITRWAKVHNRSFAAEVRALVREGLRVTELREGIMA